MALVTNTTSRPRASIATAWAQAGFPVSAADILTAPAIAAAYLTGHHPGARCLLLNSGQIADDLAVITLARGDDLAPVEVVLVGGAGPEFSYQALNRAFGHLQGGARLRVSPFPDDDASARATDTAGEGCRAADAAREA